MNDPPPGAPAQPAGRQYPQGRGRGGRARNQNFDGNRRGQANGNRSGRRGWGGNRETPSIIGAGPEREDRRLNDQPLTPSKLPTVNNDLTQEDILALGQVAANQEVCFICASPIEHLSITPCNHQTCHICALRLRALYKKRDCAYCKTEAPWVIFTDDATRRYEDFAGNEIVQSDKVLGVRYEKAEIYEDTVLLLRYNCPDNDCDIACMRWPELFRHVKTKHGKHMCNLCTRNKKVFTHEHELFTVGELRRHEKFGDDNPGAVNQSGFRGHPECGFCRERFYGDDELYDHCREKHERCHICDRRNPGAQVQYYLNYDDLEKHFAEAHFMCMDPECQASKTNVYEAELDLKAHQLHAHPNGMSKDVRRDARVVNISNFDFRTPYLPERRDRGHRGNGRGTDPNNDPIPVSTAQPMRRDELAYQRQMAIINAQPVSQAQLARSSRAPPIFRTTEHQPRQPSPATPDFASLSLNSQLPRPTQTPQEAARQIAHDSVTQRAAQLLSNDPTKLTQFQTQVSSYRQSSIDASTLITSLMILFPNSPAQTGTLIRELADLFPSEPQRLAILSALNDHSTTNPSSESAYPSLPPGTPSEGSVTGGRRVLRLKSSTAQSSRSEVSRQGSWGSAATAVKGASSAGNPFPALGGPSLLNNGQKRAAWTAAGVVSSMSTRLRGQQGAAKETTKTNNAGRSGQAANEEMFPALPQGRRLDVTMAGLTRGTVRWDDGSARQGNAWGQGNKGEDGDGDKAGGEKAGTGKKGKKGKQVLIKFG